MEQIKTHMISCTSPILKLRIKGRSPCHGFRNGTFEMIKVEITFLIKKNIDSVFELISDIANYRKWVPQKSMFFIENKITSDGPIGLNTTYFDRLKWFGKAIGEIVEFQVPFKIKFKQRTSFCFLSYNMIIEYTFKSIQDYTEVIHNVEVESNWLIKIFEPIMSFAIRSEREQTCKSIQQVLEQ